MEKNKLLMIVIIVLLLVMLGTIVGGAVYFMGVLKQVTAESPQTNVQTNPGYLSAEDIKTYTLAESFSTNLLSTAENKESSFIRIGSIALGINMLDKKTGDAFYAMVSEKEIIIRDAISSIIRSKTYDYMMQENSESYIADEILLKMQEIFKTNLIVKIYLSDILVQMQ